MMTKKKVSKDKATKSLDTLFQELKKKHLRMTGPRKMIIEGLFENHGPFTVEEIHKKFIRSTCDLATVYRCLISLEQANLLRRCEFGDGFTRYELGGEERHHHHLICSECKKVEIVEKCEIEDQLDQFAKKRGFTKVRHMLEFFGVCPDCKDTAA